MLKDIQIHQSQRHETQGKARHDPREQNQKDRNSSRYPPPWLPVVAGIAYYDIRSDGDQTNSHKTPKKHFQLFFGVDNLLQGFFPKPWGRIPESEPGISRFFKFWQRLRLVRRHHKIGRFDSIPVCVEVGDYSILQNTHHQSDVIIISPLCFTHIL